MRVTSVIKRSGHNELFDINKVYSSIARAGAGYDISMKELLEEIGRNIFDNITTADLEKAYVLAAVTFIEKDPLYNILAARLLRQRLARDVLGKHDPSMYHQQYRSAFQAVIIKAVNLGYLDARMATYDLEVLAQALNIERDELLKYTGMHTLYERYFLRHGQQRLELVQMFWMRIAMGLALNEEHKERRALEFYELLSTLRYVPSTPTLFHSGFPVAQLSSCYLNTVNDDLGHIFKVMADNAQLSKWAGGIGSDWTPIRGTGSYIKSIKATSQGVVPYLKIANDVVVAITRSGIRRGGACSYLEVWHFDIEEFLDLRRNTGDERRRTHDMSTANWIPDLFMKRVQEDGKWTLFSPDEVPDLHEIYGATFEARYKEYEQRAENGAINLFKVVSAKQLWRKMLTRLFETGHPWITFKDPCNIRSPQDHVGVVHSSNLCTEITLNTSESEIAVCNLGSVNLERHVIDGVCDQALLEQTVTTAVRILDNVIDLNFYPAEEARNSNMRHRPVGLGLMGFQDALFKMNIPFSSQAALEFADVNMEQVSYFAIKASTQLAQERGTYPSFKGSKWDRGIFPLDTVDILEKERGMKIEVSRTKRLDWDALKAVVKQYGMRNSNLMAIAPTATISTIVDCYPCIEPLYKNIYVKSNVSGEFTILNSYLVEDLKKLGLWGKQMLDQLKYYDGDLARIAAIPAYLKEKYKTAFELDPVWLVKITATRGKWIDQSQSHNVFMQGVSGGKLDQVYTTAWRWGMKTLYYLRTLGASQIEKATLDAKEFGFTQKREYADPVTVPAAVPVMAMAMPKACGIEDPTCESCQ